MEPRDYKTFTDAWNSAHEVMPGGKVLSSGAMRMCIDALSKHPIDLLLEAISRHVKTGRFAPAPRDIIEILNTGGNHLSADEAWAIVPKSEAETVVWTNEMADAFAIAYPLIDDGDMIGARMAFRSAYERICENSRMMQLPVRWKVCLGYDKARVEPAVTKAVQQCRISQDHAKKYIPAPSDGGAIGKLLTGKFVDVSDNAKLKQHWAGLKQALIDGQERLEESERLAREKKRLDFEERREAALRSVKEKIESK